PSGSSTRGRPTRSSTGRRRGSSRLDRDGRRRVALNPYVEEDHEEEDQRPAQEGQPRHEAQRRPRLTPADPTTEDLFERRSPGCAVCAPDEQRPRWPGAAAPTAVGT